jgi:hypothetical protein
MSADPYFAVQYLSFSFTTHLAYGDARLQRHNLLGPFDDVITEFECTINAPRQAFTQFTVNILVT